MWTLCQPVLCATNLHMLGVTALCSTLSTSLAFSLPNLEVQSSIETDSHSEVHDSLVNSTLSSFNFHLNLSSISLGASLLIVVLIVIISRKQNKAIASISAQILRQKRALETFKQWKVDQIQN
jgi:hypothetical protein